MGRRTRHGHAPFMPASGPVVNAPAGPLRLAPDLRARPWGGDRLRAWWPDATADVADAPIGEAWLAGPESRVGAGPWATRTLEDLAGAYGAAFVGTAPYGRHGGRMPLLVKLLDAGTALSVQVHPDDAYARRAASERGDLGKTEAWWVLDATPEAHVWWGFRHPVERAALADAIERGTLLELLRRIEVSRDDVVVNLAGTVHALGGGVLAYEVQQASDVTYRLYDHGRVDADGRPRALHVAQALDVALTTPGAEVAPVPRVVAPGRTELTRTHAFVLERIEGAVGAAWRVAATSLEVLTHLGGDPVALRGRGGEVSLERGATVVLPAGMGAVEVNGSGVLARAWFPADAA